MSTCVLCLQAHLQIAYTHEQMYSALACYEPPEDELTVWVLEYKMLLTDLHH